jgi:prephenate dehydratase
MKIAIQGEKGSFSHDAALHMLPNCTVVSCARSAEVFDRAEKRSVDGAVIPIENTLAGSVAEHFDLLLNRDVFIQREFALRIVHNLIAAPGVKLRDVRRVFSHPVALDQCRGFLSKHPKIEAVPFYDTAGAVKNVLENALRDAAGIASKQAAAVYGGTILAAGIEDNRKNFTRFFLIRARRRVLPEANKTSIAFKLKNVPGALFQALSVFALRDISLSKIESRPIGGRPWEYAFFADFLRGDDSMTRSALRALDEVAESVKVLGVYPATKMPLR